MLFNSIAFLIFLPIVYLVYWKLLAHDLRKQNAFVLLASYFFYGWWDWRFLSLIFISSLVDFMVGPIIAKSIIKHRRRAWLILSLCVNLGMLGFFKYYNFFVDSLIESFSWFGFHLNHSGLDIILPVGISFYTFQTLSYSIDIYKGKIEPTKDWLSFFAFVSFFPQLVAGPIERAAHLLPQFQHKRQFDLQFTINGMRIMLWGFFKKVVIADNLAGIVDLVYSSPAGFSGPQVWLASVLFAVQVYADFSGYSDIAIGCGRMFGFDLMTNFKTPYFSRSFSEFWNRWHISLSTWFRDYIYFPLGGNKVSSTRWLFNILVVFTVSGLWHGAKWTFIIWGILGGVFMIFGRYKLPFIPEFLAQVGISDSHPLKKYYDMFVVFALWTFSLIFFRANSTSDLPILLNSALVTSWSQFIHPSTWIGELTSMFESSRQVFLLLLSVCLLFGMDGSMKKRDFGTFLTNRSGISRWGIYFGVLAWIFLFGAFSRPENFVYFQF
ncbi:MAG: MBOAT family O-acyltransferase [Vicingaceae bacterium]